MKKHTITFGMLLLAVAAIFVISACTPSGPNTNNQTTQQGDPTGGTYDPGQTYEPVQTGKGTKDLWQFEPTAMPQTSGGGVIGAIKGALGGSGASAPLMQTNSMDAARGYSEGNIGLSVGGAKDINNFRENIENNYLPLFTDITYEGLFYDYYFDTGAAEKCDELFCPSYTSAVSKDPFSKQTEYYLSVGLNSGIKESDFARKKLNLVVVLDISGSMGSPFNRYYYDQFGARKEFDLEYEEDFKSTKMEVASESVVALLDNLGDEDRFGLVVFDNGGYLANPLTKIGEIDIDQLKDHILELRPQGGTNMESGMRLGTEQFEEYLESDSEEYENRIIFLTDAMPNRGVTSEEGLIGIARNNAENRLFSTFIGIGVDFNTELIEAITKIQGANYYSVHSSSEFKERMDDEFEYMVTPLVFDLKLELDAQGYDIIKVYGSPEADEATGEIMKVNTLFPSKRENEETRGGIIVLKLKKMSDDASLTLRTSYKDRSGKQHSNEKSIVLDSVQPESFDNTGIRKAILLSRYTNLMKNWVINERQHVIDDVPMQPTIYRCEPELVGSEDRCGIIEPPVFPEHQLSRWERQSVPLSVSDHYKELISEFRQYYTSEMNEIGDKTLYQEVEIMDKLVSA